MSYALIIDDDQAQISNLRKAVEARGLEIESASSWDEGYALFNALSPDLVIADYNLPGSKHGLRLLLEISRLRPSVKLILVSAFLNDEDAQAILDLGLVDAVLRKLDPVQTARAIVEEVAEAGEHRQDRSDWVAFATAAGRARRVSEEDLEKLDSFLQANRLPRDAPGGST